MNKKDNLGFNILKLNPARLRDPDESLFILAGEYLEREMTLYEGHLALSMTDATDRFKLYCQLFRILKFECSEFVLILQRTTTISYS